MEFQGSPPSPNSIFKGAGIFPTLAMYGLAKHGRFFAAPEA